MSSVESAGLWTLLILLDSYGFVWCNIYGYVNNILKQTGGLKYAEPNLGTGRRILK